MTDFILPDIGEGIVECELVEWLVAEGDWIKEDQAVAEVMTDKALVQIPAMHTGQIRSLYYQKGDVAKVHSPLFSMVIADETSEQEPTEAAKETNDNEEVVVNGAVTEVEADVAEDFILPDIGEGIVECELVEWLVAEGDDVKEDQAVAEVMTDKALVQIPAKHDGKISKLYYAKGDIAKVHTPLFCQIIKAGTGNHVVEEKSAPSAAIAKSNNRPEPSANTSVKRINTKAIASPAVRRLAREQGLDIYSVIGSGKKGRVMKCDIAAAAKSAVSPSSAKAKEAKPVVQGGQRSEAIKGVRAIMAKQMQESVSTIPHFTVSDEVCMDNLINARQQLKAEFEQQELKLSFMPFIIKALSLALAEFPILNSQVNKDCNEITYFDDHNIGLAVDSKIGLLVPNIKAVQTLSFRDIVVETNRLVDLARQGRLSNQDLSGGSISISNVGVIGGTVATPIINKPEVAIVALGKIQKLPRFNAQEQVIASNIMHISWSGDHRIIDGATMVRFSNLWKSHIENPFSLFSLSR